MLMVAGGYVNKSKRTITIEVYNERQNSWELTGFELSYPLEASFFFNNDSSIIYFGGRWDVSGDTTTVYKLSLDN